MSKESVLRPIGVKQINISDLSPNPHNPRMLFDDIPMQTLEESIAKVGILVPLTVLSAQLSFIFLDFS